VSKNDLLNGHFVAWMDAEKGPESDIVISSRIRLARNLQDISFPYFMNAEKGNKTMQEIREAWRQSEDQLLSSLELLSFDNTSAWDRQILVEKHLISPEHGTAEEAYRGLLLSEDGSIAIMINEEDHLRIQVMLPGLQLEKCYDLAQPFQAFIGTFITDKFTINFTHIALLIRTLYPKAPQQLCRI
jgi:protein arginine kinase